MMDSYQIQARLCMCTLNGWQIKLIYGRPLSILISGGQLVKPSFIRVSIIVLAINNCILMLLISFVFD